MKRVTTSAPGKLMLLGDHAVVYDRPCLVTAVDYRVFSEVSVSDKDIYTLPNGCKANFVETALEKFRKKYSINQHVSVKTWADYDESYGLGSSSAVTVALVKGLCALFSIPITEKELFSICYEVVIAIQGVGSGFDIASAVYGGTLYFVTGGSVIEPLSVKELPLLVGYSGTKGDTAILVKMVGNKLQKDPKAIEHLFNQSAQHVDAGKEALLNFDIELFGSYMNKCHRLLQQLGVSTEQLNSMVIAAQKAGAYGAKLSGAGGGDCMIALASDDKRSTVKQAIEKAGGTIVHVNSNAEGVKVH